MAVILVIVAVVVFLAAPHVVIMLLTNVHNILGYMVKDGIESSVHKKSRLVKTGEIVGFTGLFGQGKTLSAVHHVTSIYRRHNDVRVYCPRRKKWVKQVVHIVSNVHIKNVSYERLESLEQVVLSTDTIREEDDKNDTLTITLVLIDEAGSELNSRAFRNNIDPLLLNTILTCRHWNISLFYTAQRFGHVDALLRQVTSYVLDCHKIWRFQFQKKYDAWELEQASNPSNIVCSALYCWFVKDKDYHAYDTYECVDKLKKDMKAGEMMSSEEILALRQGPEVANMDGVNYSKKYKKRVKKLY